ncbi:unnamed protein product [Citrullus colocynthis]|uniref:Uncharacterized protein n=1 Tax=Citrullus colocynthis TaxID=252529 RepID=A0ABP0YWG6_9ROSI
MPMKRPTKSPLSSFLAFRPSHVDFLYPITSLYRKYPLLSPAITALAPSQQSQEFESKLLCSAVKVSFLTLYSLLTLIGNRTDILLSCEIAEFPHAYSHL